jgi:hypothetical protein
MDVEETREVEATVFYVMADFGIAKVVTADDLQFTLTRHTKDVVISDLHVGQRLRCTIAADLPSVVRAALFQRED